MLKPFISILAYLSVFERGPRSFSKVSRGRREQIPNQILSQVADIPQTIKQCIAFGSSGSDYFGGQKRATT